MGSTGSITRSVKKKMTSLLIAERQKKLGSIMEKGVVMKVEDSALGIPAKKNYRCHVRMRMNSQRKKKRLQLTLLEDRA